MFSSHWRADGVSAS
ncbi:hypothetical protein YPPY71_1214, partial [Yersinia pestis PY-71]